MRGGDGELSGGELSGVSDVGLCGGVGGGDGVEMILLFDEDGDGGEEGEVVGDDGEGGVVVFV